MPAVSVQFALILEAYCRGSIPHIEVLKKQVTTHMLVRVVFVGVFAVGSVVDYSITDISFKKLSNYFLN